MAAASEFLLVTVRYVREIINIISIILMQMIIFRTVLFFLMVFPLIVINCVATGHANLFINGNKNIQNSSLILSLGIK